MPISQNILMMLEGDSSKGKKKKSKIARYFSGELSTPEKQKIYRDIEKPDLDQVRHNKSRLVDARDKRKNILIDPKEVADEGSYLAGSKLAHRRLNADAAIRTIKKEIRKPFLDVKNKFKSDVARFQSKRRNTRIGLAGVGTIAAGGVAHHIKKQLTATPKTGSMTSNASDVIKNKIMEHPKTAAAIASAGALGTGYGAYRYIKNRKKNKV